MFWFQICINLHRPYIAAPSMALTLPVVGKGWGAHVAHLARQINGPTFCMSKQSDLGGRVTRVSQKAG